MKTKSLFVKVIISVAILSLGIIIGKYLPLIKFEKPKIKQYEYLGKINTESKAPIKPLPYNISNDNAVNKSGVVTNAATAYKIGSSLIQLNLNLRISPIYSTYNLYVINYKSIIYVAKNQDV